MKKENWNQALSEIDADLVEEFVAKTEWIEKNNRHRRILLRVTALAACLCLIVGILFNLSRKSPAWVIPPWDVPTWDNAMYSAEELAKMVNLPMKDGDATNAYTEVYVPNETFLKLNPIPDTEYLNIYEYRKTPLPLSKTDFEGFANTFFQKIAKSLNETLPDFRIIEKRDYDNTITLEIESQTDQYDISLRQNSLTHFVALHSKNNQKIVLDSTTVKIDQRLTDEEILDSLQGIKNCLLDIFGVSFPDAEVVRYYDGYSENGVTGIEVYFYQEETTIRTLAADSTPQSNYIVIKFKPQKTYNVESSVNTDMLYSETIYFKANRNDSSIRYEHIANAKMISLEDAEKLLYNGYVFGFHVCPLCMANQAQVSFRDYDFVALEYKMGYDGETQQVTGLIPFYAFYKRIGTAENGNHIYAKTYVAAIEISGYKEYFQKQIKKHL